MITREVAKKALKPLIVFVVVALAVTVGYLFYTYRQEQARQAQVDATAAEIEQLMNDPEQLYNRVVEKTEPDAALRAVDYKQAKFADTMLKVVREVLNGSSLPEHLKSVRENPTDKTLKSRSDMVIRQLEKQGEAVIVDLDITPAKRYNYFLLSTEVTLDADETSIENALASFVAPFKLLCEHNYTSGEPFDCRKPIDGVALSKQHITLYPFKISDSPLTYRIYGFLRSTTGKS